jgi:hypothetical protein
MIHLD